MAVATRWIADGTAQAVLAAIRAESTLRQTIARGILPGPAPSSKPEAFHYWLPLPAGTGLRLPVRSAAVLPPMPRPSGAEILGWNSRWRPRAPCGWVYASYQ
ncbi:hypothetical protein [Azospirillum endophyticum]